MTGNSSHSSQKRSSPSFLLYKTSDSQQSRSHRYQMASNNWCFIPVPDCNPHAACAQSARSTVDGTITNLLVLRFQSIQSFPASRHGVNPSLILYSYRYILSRTQYSKSSTPSLHLTSPPPVTSVDLSILTYELFSA